MERGLQCSLTVWSGTPSGKDNGAAEPSCVPELRVQSFPFTSTISQFLGPWLSPDLHHLLQPLTKVSPKAAPNLVIIYFICQWLSERLIAAISISSSLGLPYMATSLQTPCLLIFLSPNPHNHQLTHCGVSPAQRTELFLHIKKLTQLYFHKSSTTDIFYSY